MQVQSHTFISFGTVGRTLWLFVIVIDRLIRDESLTVNLYASGFGEDEAHVEGKVYTCTTVPVHKNRLRNIVSFTNSKHN